MTLNVTVPEAVYRQMAERGSRERFLAAMDKVPSAEPAPEDRI